ncbi:glutamyl-tRNA(Gln) amidotransferase subunit B, mitochondrial [Cimex lectularius]|uniref:Glutamyl-tRNA(Gln) amidotransferase subunit B, mitochondrial n=1 Tax=Cimex lectularius TaxID=79782 RepID=A0A8I6THU5_CIMLE|nr:glutamyl-tRNA(Gln) amidotransferase subunit B, mitochondrial [Cimex lectularius]
MLYKLIRGPPHTRCPRVYFSTKTKKGSKWNSVVGLEVHAQINTKSKLFSGASTSFGGLVNSSVALFDAAIPGTLPVLNRSCVESGILTALALSCRVNQVSTFDRKHYFYSDLPAGYQITQQRAPLANDGKIHFHIFTPGVHKTPYDRWSRLKQIQLEQDSGKSLHEEIIEYTLVDLNRAGIPLMELVFEPDLSDGEEAAALVKELILILSKINTCSCKMEEGALRVDANISVNKQGEPLGTRTEVKNISSIRGVANAVNFEIKRQIEILEKGGEIVNETRAWDAINAQTLPMRDKEVKQDYRFMPEPNLPPLRVNTSKEDFPGVISVEKLRDSLPELPEDTRKRLAVDFGLSRDMIIHLVGNDQLYDVFLQLLKENKERDVKTIAKFITIELMMHVNKETISLEDISKLIGLGLGEIIDLLQNDRINLTTARKLLSEIINGNPQTPFEIVEKENLYQITDEQILREICLEAMKNNPTAVEKYRKGKVRVLSFLLDYISEQTNNRAKMSKVIELIREMLNSK